MLSHPWFLFKIFPTIICLVPIREIRLFPQWIFVFSFNFLFIKSLFCYLIYLIFLNKSLLKINSHPENIRILLFILPYKRYFTKHWWIYCIHLLFWPFFQWLGQDLPRNITFIGANLILIYILFWCCSISSKWSQW